MKIKKMLVIKSLLSNLNMYAYILLASTIAFLYVQNGILKKNNEICIMQIDLHNKQLIILEESSKLRADKIDSAITDAKKRIDEDILESNELMELDIPKDCNLAISWGIDQALKI